MSYKLPIPDTWLRWIIDPTSFEAVRSQFLYPTGSLSEVPQKEWPFTYEMTNTSTYEMADMMPSKPCGWMIFENENAAMHFKLKYL
jgi:hypothetical protein